MMNTLQFFFTLLMLTEGLKVASTGVSKSSFGKDPVRWSQLANT